MTRAVQTLREGQVFKGFASVCPLEVDLLSIDHRNPPEPDVFCITAQTGPRAFELAEIIDPVVPRDLDRIVGLKFAMMALYESDLSIARLEQNLGDALVSVGIAGSISVHRRRSVLGPILDFLATIPNDHVGHFALPIKGAPPALESVRVLRGIVGPVFDVDGGGAFTTPVLKTVKSKCAKRYGVTTDLDLVAYFDTLPALTNELWLTDSVVESIGTELTGSQFSRLWIYDYSANRIVAVISPS